MATINDLYQLDSTANTGGIDAGANSLRNLERAASDLGTTSQEAESGSRALEDVLGDLKQGSDSAQEGIDDLRKSQGELGKNTRESSTALVNFKAGLDLVKEAGSQAAAIIDQVIGKTLDYNQAVDGISQSIGISAEEASKLAYTMQAVGVSQSEVETAIRSAISKGIDPSIAGMQKLADQYNDIQDPIERSQFLLDTFGRSGLAMGDLLEKGADGIAALSDQAEQYGLVLDDKALAATKRFEENLRGFQAQVDGVKVSIGNSLIDTFNTLPGPMQEVIALTVQMSTELGPVISGGASLIKVFKEFGPGMKVLKGGFEALKTGGAALTAELGLLAAGIAIIMTYLDRVSKAAQATTDDLVKMSHSGDLFDQAAASTEIMIHGQDRLKVALDGTHEKIKSGARDYADYKSSIEATAKAAGFEIDAEGNLYKVVSDGLFQKKQIIQANYELSEGSYAVATSAEAQAYAQDVANKALAAFNELSGNVFNSAKNNTAAYYGSRDALREMYTAQREANAWISDGTAKMTDLKTAMSGALSKEFDSFNEKQDALKEKARELQSTISTSYGTARDDATAALRDVNKELGANADAHDVATKRILFGYAEQQLAVGGLSEAEATALDALAVKWNLKSQEDINAMKAIRDAAAGLAADGSIAGFVDGVTGALDQANGAMNDTQQKLYDVAKAHGALSDQPPANLQVGIDTTSATASAEEMARQLHTMPPLEIPAAVKIDLNDVRAVAGDSMKERREELRTARAEIEKPIVTEVTAKTTQAQIDLKEVQIGQQAIAPVVQSAVIIDNSQAMTALQEVLNLLQKITGIDLSGGAPAAQAKSAANDYADRMRARGMNV